MGEREKESGREGEREWEWERLPIPGTGAKRSFCLWKSENGSCGYFLLCFTALTRPNEAETVLSALHLWADSQLESN